MYFNIRLAKLEYTLGWKILDVHKEQNGTKSNQGCFVPFILHTYGRIIFGIFLLKENIGKY